MTVRTAQRPELQNGDRIDWRLTESTGATSRPYPMASQSADPPRDDTPDGSDAGEDPFSPGVPQQALTGFLVALTSVIVPVMAVFTDRNAPSGNQIPTALERDGSQSAAALTIPGNRQSPGGESSGQPSPLRLQP